MAHGRLTSSAVPLGLRELGNSKHRSLARFALGIRVFRYLYIVSDESRLEQLSGGLCDARDQGEVILQISTFLTGGFTKLMDIEGIIEPRSEKRRVSGLLGRRVLVKVAASDA